MVLRFACIARTLLCLASTQSTFLKFLRCSQFSEFDSNNGGFQFECFVFQFCFIQCAINNDIADILESGSEDFESGEEIYDAVGSILAEVAGDEGDDKIIDLCNQLMGALKG